MKAITVAALETDLSEAGHLLVESARRQGQHLATITKPNKAGVITVILDDECDTDDEMMIWLRDPLSFAERAHTYGVPGLCETDWSGSMGVEGPIPTEDYIARVERMRGKRYGHGRPWYVPSEVLRRVRRREISGAEALNEAGEALLRFCAEGQFEIA